MAKKNIVCQTDDGFILYKSNRGNDRFSYILMKGNHYVASSDRTGDKLMMLNIHDRAAFSRFYHLNKELADRIF